MRSPGTITTDDPRHGSPQGYNAGCRQNCCRRVYAVAQKTRRHRRNHGWQGRHPAIGVQRRLQGLLAIGWTYDLIGERMGVTAQAVQQLQNRKYVLNEVRNKVLAVYRELHMTPGPSDKNRREAKTEGWVPPLSWDDETIDDPATVPYKAPNSRRTRRESNRAQRETVDHVIVQRAMEGIKVDANPAERNVIISRWLEAGLPITHLDAIQGWSTHRFLKEQAA